MRKLILVSLTLLLVCSVARNLQAQQPSATPGALTFYYDYTVFPGKEEELNSLINTVGAPVRDKLLAEGVIMAWGMETPILRQPGGTTHLIWFTVADYAGDDEIRIVVGGPEGVHECVAELPALVEPSYRFCI